MYIPYSSLAQDDVYGGHQTVSLRDWSQRLQGVKKLKLQSYQHAFSDTNWATRPAELLLTFATSGISASL
jgi:hypothetical protein